jgi:segregation and condensation protein A
MQKTTQSKDLQVKQEPFSGPLVLLLDLLEKRELAISDLHLAEIADEFLELMKTSDLAPMELADFLTVAARLVVLKMRELAPYLIPEEEDEGATLAKHVEVVKFLREIAEQLGEFYAQAPTHLSAFKPQKVHTNPEDAPYAFTVNDLERSMARIFRQIEPFFEKDKEVLERIATVEERIAHVVDLVNKHKKVHFSKIKLSARQKSDIVVSFLAVLQLMRDGRVSARQEERDIIVEAI